MKSNDILRFVQNQYCANDLDVISNKIKDVISRTFDSSGIMYRIFVRAKDKDSVLDKINRKKNKYDSLKNYYIQDAIGIRIVLYFMDDVEICINMLSDIFKENNHEVDELDTSTFKPERINYVYDIPKEFSFPYEYKDKGGIDNTFEIQIRTVFSEGWHEVEHDIRYKHQTDWDGEYEMGRDLNALFAVLELCDNNIIGICDNLSYNKYKKHDIEAMIRNRFRIRIKDRHIRNELIEIINRDYDVIAKKIFRFDRYMLISTLGKTAIERTLDNIVYIINYFDIKNEDIKNLTDSCVLEKLSLIEKESVINLSKENYKSIVAMKY